MRPLENFIRALRAREVRISVIEAMEAHEVLANLGFADRTLLKDALSLTLAKTVIEKQRFDESFDLFFSRTDLDRARTQSILDDALNGADDPFAIRDADILFAFTRIGDDVPITMPIFFRGCENPIICDGKILAEIDPA